MEQTDVVATLETLERLLQKARDPETGSWIANDAADLLMCAVPALLEVARAAEDIERFGFDARRWNCVVAALAKLRSQEVFDGA